MQVAEAIHRYGKPSGARAAGLRRPAHQPADAGPAAWRRHRRRDAGSSRGPPDARPAVARCRGGGRPRRGRRDARHGLRRGPRDDPLVDAARRARPRCSPRRSRRPIARIAGAHLRDPIRVQVRPEQRGGDGAARVRQVAYVVRRADKLVALGRILDLEDPTSALVFARTRGEVDELAERLAATAMTRRRSTAG